MVIFGESGHEHPAEWMLRFERHLKLVRGGYRGRQRLMATPVILGLPETPAVGEAQTVAAQIAG